MYYTSDDKYGLDLWYGIQSKLYKMNYDLLQISKYYTDTYKIHLDNHKLNWI